MPLLDLNLLVGGRTLPAQTRTFLREAQRRIDRFRLEHRIPGFIPSDFRRAYLGLRALAAAELTPGNLFCEWGSGFGVVTCLAAMLGFEAHGIEIEADLVDAARELANDFDLPAEFVRGSFIPPGTNLLGRFAWMDTDEGHDDPALAPDDFDVIFAYPWPDEEGAIAELFDQCAAEGAILVTYHGMDGLRWRRKTDNV